MKGCAVLCLFVTAFNAMFVCLNASEQLEPGMFYSSARRLLRWDNTTAMRVLISVTFF